MNALSMFMMLTNEVPKSFPGKFVVIYLDEFLFSLMEEHLGLNVPHVLVHTHFGLALVIVPHVLDSCLCA